MRFRLRTLLILLAVLPPLLWIGWGWLEAMRLETIQREEGYRISLSEIRRAHSAPKSPMAWAKSMTDEGGKTVLVMVDENGREWVQVQR